VPASLLAVADSRFVHACHWVAAAKALLHCSGKGHTQLSDNVRQVDEIAPNRLDGLPLITSVQCWRRWTASDKIRMVEENFEPGMNGELGSSPAWHCPKPAVHVRRLVSHGGMTAAGSGEEVAPASPSLAELHVREFIGCLARGRDSQRSMRTIPRCVTSRLERYLYWCGTQESAAMLASTAGPPR
jgi:hypothetical protein